VGGNLDMNLHAQSGNTTYQFHNWEIPVAYSMLELAQRSSTDYQTYRLFQRYMCYWVAFNNIYATIGEREGLQPQLVPGKVDQIEGYQFARVNAPRERDLIDMAFIKFTDDLKHELAVHESTKFFVERKPLHNGRPVTVGQFNQPVNGVLNVGYSIKGYPRYSPIDETSYKEYIADNSNTQARDRVAKQVLNITYTVRNNLFHGGKRSDDGNAEEVLEKALPLLRLIVVSFLADYAERY
jgi:hypothetical protein